MAQLSTSIRVTGSPGRRKIECARDRTTRLARFGSQCIQDVRGRFAGNVDMVVWKGVKLCNVKKLGLFFDRSSGRPFATYE